MNQFEGHTPGPWTVDYLSIKAADGDYVAGIVLSVDIDRPWAEKTANAALIAAAPDLLAERNALRSAALNLQCALLVEFNETSMPQDIRFYLDELEDALSY